MSEKVLCKKWKNSAPTPPDLLDVQSYGRGLLTAQYNNTSDADRYVFISIPFNEGWKVTVNGEAAKIWRANFGLTGVRTPPGFNKLEMNFSQPGAIEGSWITVTCLISLALFYLVNLFLGRDKFYLS